MLDFDVIVCGGGTAGAAAGIKAARLGSKVLIVEQMGALGGTQSMGWVTPMMPNYLAGEQLSRGINLEIQQEHAKLSPPADFPHAQIWYNPLVLAHVLDTMAADAGAQCLFNAYLFEANVNSGKIQSVAAHTKQGTVSASARVFVDATGDADIAALAGAGFDSGDESGTNQPMTLRFTVGNVDIQSVLRFFGDKASPDTPEFLSVGFAEAKDSMIGEIVRSAVNEGVLQEDDLGYFQFFSVLGRARELAFNCPRITSLSPLDAFDISKAYSLGRQKIFRIHDFCKRYLEGFEDSYVSVIAPLMGVRESRRIIGDYVLTEDDHQQCRKFDDAIARNRYPIDVHLAKGGVDLRKLPSDDYHEIPYRCLLPVGIENLFVAGRCLSATFAAQSSVRIQPVCRAMGEAAGAAAALCVKLKTTPRTLPYSELRPHLDLSVG